MPIPTSRRPGTAFGRTSLIMWSFDGPAASCILPNPALILPAAKARTVERNHRLPALNLTRSPLPASTPAPTDPPAGATAPNINRSRDGKEASGSLRTCPDPMNPVGADVRRRTGRFALPFRFVTSAPTILTGSREGRSRTRHKRMQDLAPLAAGPARRRSQAPGECEIPACVRSGPGRSSLRFIVLL